MLSNYNYQQAPQQ